VKAKNSEENRANYITY